jgi:hypothetical protein
MKRASLFFLSGAIVLSIALILATFGQFASAQDGDDDDETSVFGDGDCEVRAVSLIGAWVDGGAPETDAFDFTAEDGSTCSGTFDDDIQPLFVTDGVWFENSLACGACHHGHGEDSYHEMDLTNYEGIRAGADVNEDPPGESLLGESEPGAGDFNWEESELRHRLRDNRMPAHSPFIINESNRDGPLVTVNGVEILAVDLIGAWVEAGAPETEPFGEYEATFAANIAPMFYTPSFWFEGAQPCVACHFGDFENSYHEMNLSTYEGIRAGADVNEAPPGESLLGESEPGAGDFNWEESVLRGRLRDNRMPPPQVFLRDESNRDGPIILAGTN